MMPYQKIVLYTSHQRSSQDKDVLQTFPAYPGSVSRPHSKGQTEGTPELSTHLKHSQGYS